MEEGLQKYGRRGLSVPRRRKVQLVPELRTGQSFPWAGDRTPFRNTVRECSKQIISRYHGHLIWKYFNRRSEAEPIT